MAKTVDRKVRRRSRRRKLLIAGVLLGAMGVGVYLHLQKEKPEETYATVAVERHDLVDVLAETGSIELVRTVEVKSTIAGEVRRLLVEAGDWVEPGQLLALIEPDPNQSLLLYQKRSAVERGEINLAEQERDFERTQALYTSNMLSTREFETAKTALVRARNDLRLARLELAILETKANLTGQEHEGDPGELDEVRVLAPIGGIVIHRGVEIGEVVASGLSAYAGGTLLFTIGDPSRMVVRADIAEVDIGHLRVGLDVDIMVDAYPDTLYRGRVRWIAPVAQRRQGSPIVSFDTVIDILDNELRLRQGMSCDIDIILARRDSALCLPAESVLEIQPEDPSVKRRKPRYVAYVVRSDSAAVDAAATGRSAADGDPGAVPDPGGAPVDADKSEPAGPSAPLTFALERFEEVELQVGLTTATRIEILGGLQAMDRVAADPELIRRRQAEADAAPATTGRTFFRW